MPLVNCRRSGYVMGGGALTMVVPVSCQASWRQTLVGRNNLRGELESVMISSGANEPPDRELSPALPGHNGRSNGAIGDQFSLSNPRARLNRSPEIISSRLAKPPPMGELDLVYLWPISAGCARSLPLATLCCRPRDSTRIGRASPNGRPLGSSPI